MIEDWPEWYRPTGSYRPLDVTARPHAAPAGLLHQTGADTLKAMTDASTILVTVNADDRPGITAGLMAVLARTRAEIYDIEQIVVRRRLTLNILIGVDEGRSTISELLFYGWEHQLRIEFDAIEAEPAEPKRTHIVTVIGSRVSPEDFGSVADAIASGGGNIDRIFVFPATR